ncbi:MAG: DNA double-strand break repair nuclease NurA [Pyrinomonadaceae bacterium]
MLYRELLTSELHNQREDFRRYASEQSADLEFYFEALKKLEKENYSELEKKLFAHDNAGAIPTDEIEINNSFTFSFTEKWANHEQARKWANGILQNRTTFAADGSQIYAEKDTSLPVGAIQIGWFENPHSTDKSYEKNVSFRILSPKELLEDLEEPLNPETRVGEERFYGEVNKVKDFLIKHRGWQVRGERMPLAFFDNTLLVSFSLPQTVLQEGFLRAVLNLINLSKETKVPLVGYVDRSFSRDLIHLLDAFSGKTNEDKKTLYDATILHAEIKNNAPILKNWGDRTCFCFSRRKGLNIFYTATESLIGFVYLQTTADSTPARLDIPAWIYEENLLSEVLDTVRAECVVGLGYPYALETADQTAVITMRDREIFLGALQEFASREKLNFNVSRKNASKGRRR